MKTYYQSATSYKDILRVRKETRVRLLSLQIVSDSREHIYFSSLLRNFVLTRNS